MKSKIALAVILPALLVMSALSSCVKEGLDQPSDFLSGQSREVTVNLSVPTSGTFAPGTKSSPNEMLKDVYVLAFSQKKGEEGKSYRYSSRATLLAPAKESVGTLSFTVLLKTSEEGELYDFVFVANAETEMEGALKGVAEGDSKETVLKALKFDTSHPWDISANPVPLSGQLVDMQISEDQAAATLGNVKLYRSMAQLDIVLSDGTDNLDIREVTLSGLNKQSRIVPDCFTGGETQIDYSSYTPSYVPGVETTSQTYIKDEAEPGLGFEGIVQVPESPVGSSLTLLLKAKYTDRNDPGLDGEYYYKVKVESKTVGSQIEGTEDMQAFKRNCRYILTITETRGPGFTTAEEALASVDMIEAVLEAIDEYDMNDITSDGVNQLAVDNSRLSFYKDGGVSGFSVYTDYPQGWKIHIDEAASAWIKVSSTGEGEGQTVLEGIAGSRSKVYVHVGELSEGFEGSQRQASFYIVAGRLRKRMTVIQENRTQIRIVLSPETMEFGKSPVVDRKVDVSVIPADAGTLKLQSIEGDIDFVTAPEAGGEIALESGNATLLVKPGEHTEKGSRRSWLTFVLEKDGEQLSTAILTVVQRDYDIIYTTSILGGEEGFLDYIPAAGGSTSLKVTSEYPWRMRYWTVTADGEKMDEGNEKVYQAGNSEYTFNAPANSASWKRRDFIFYPESEDGKNSLGIESFTFQQDYPDPYVAVKAAVSGKSAEKTGIDERTVSVYSNCPWKVSTSSSPLGLVVVDKDYAGGTDYVDVPATEDQKKDPQNVTLTFKAYDHPSESNEWVESDLSLAGAEVTGNVTFSSQLTHQMTGTDESETLKQQDAQLQITRTMPSLWRVNRITNDADQEKTNYIKGTAKLLSWDAQGFTADVSLNSSTRVQIKKTNAETISESEIEFEGEHYAEHKEVKFTIPSNGWANAVGSREIRTMDITLSGTNQQEPSQVTFTASQPSCWLESIEIPAATESAAPLMPVLRSPDLAALSEGATSSPSFTVGLKAVGNFETLPLYIKNQSTSIAEELLPVLTPFTRSSLTKDESPDQGYEKYSGTYLLSVPYAKSWDAHGKTFDLVYNTCHGGERNPDEDKVIGDITLKGYYVQNAKWVDEEQTVPEGGGNVLVSIQGYWPEYSVYYKVGEGKKKAIVWQEGKDADYAQYSISIPSSATTDDKVYIIKNTGAQDQTIATLEFAASIPKEGVLIDVKGGVTFDMGLDEYTGSSAASSSIKHQVTLTESFYISKYEVTNKQYCAFLNKKYKEKKINPNSFYGVTILDDTPGSDIKVAFTPYTQSNGIDFDYEQDMFVITVSEYDGFTVEEVERWPVGGVGYYGALMYAESVGGFLPTEAQWEYAAFLDSKKEVSPNLGSSERVPVDSGEPGAMGLYHMIGNIQEFVSCIESRDYCDIFDPNYPYEYDPMNNPDHKKITFSQWLSSPVENPQGKDISKFDFELIHCDYSMHRVYSVLKGYNYYSPWPTEGYNAPKVPYEDLRKHRQFCTMYLYSSSPDYARDEYGFRVAWPVAQ